MKRDIHLTCGTSVKALAKLLMSEEYMQIHRISRCADEPVYPPHLLPESLSWLRVIQSRTSRLVVLATETQVDPRGLSHRNSPFVWADEYGYVVMRRNGFFQITPFNELPVYLRPDQQEKLVHDVEYTMGRVIDTRVASELPCARSMQTVRET